MIHITPHTLFNNQSSIIQNTGLQYLYAQCSMLL